jgi:hypothetical protein
VAGADVVGELAVVREDGGVAHARVSRLPREAAVYGYESCSAERSRADLET